MIIILKLNENDKYFLNLFHNEFYKLDYDYDINIDQYLDNIFYMLLNPFEIIFEEVVFH
jgi:hypothetical protein